MPGVGNASEATILDFRGACWDFRHRDTSLQADPPPKACSPVSRKSARLCHTAVSKEHDIAIVSHYRREQSHLLPLDRLGHFTGEYDLFGQPVYTKGDLLAESVYRFKLQAVPAVVLTEIDFISALYARH